MNRATPATGWVRNPTMKSPDLDPHLASSYELGWTLNQITGCLNRTPEGLCLGGMFPCYAFTLANGRLRKRYLRADLLPKNQGIMAGSYPTRDPFHPRFWMDRVVRADQMLRASKKPLGIFPCDMSDWCGIGIPDSWSDWVLELARRYPQHRHYLLTKQPQNLPNFSPFPDNCWVGVTATNKELANEAGFWMRNIKAGLKFISVEPLLEQIDVRFPEFIEEGVDGIGWLIIGACTGTLSDLRQLNKRYRELTLIPFGKKWILQPPLGWVWTITDAAIRAGIPVFQKDNLRPLLGDNLRQEMPNG